MLFIIFLAGCSSIESQDHLTPSSNNEEFRTSTAIPLKAVDDVGESYFNPYNYATESDDEHIFYSTLTGIYKILNDDNGIDKIIDGNTIVSITLHNSTIYYIDNSKLYKVNKNGMNQITFEITHNALDVGCLNDTLFISTSDGYYTADISSDPDILTLERQPRGRPAPNGVFYSMEPVPEAEIGSNPFRISDTGEVTEISHDIWYQDYIITNLYIFYHDKDSVYRADLDGKNCIELIDGRDIDLSIIHFYNYDEEWLYVGLTPGGLSRINQETGAIELLSFDANPVGCDIVDGYLYGYDHGKKVRMKLPDGSVEFAPFS